MSAPNDTNLVRVWARDAGEFISTTSFSVKNNFEVVVELEAGSAIFGGGTQYVTGIVVRDLTKNETIFKSTTPPSIPGQMGDNFWPSAKHPISYIIHSNYLTNRQDHFFSILAFLRARVSDPDVSFAKSELLFLY